MAIESEDLIKRVEGLEVAQATQAASLAGAEATQTAMQAGNMATTAAMQAGTMATMAAGSVSLIVGIFLGVFISKSR